MCLMEKSVLIERLQSLAYDIEQLHLGRDKDLSELHRAIESALTFARLIDGDHVEMLKVTRRHYVLAKSSKTQSDKKYHYLSAVSNLRTDVGHLLTFAEMTTTTQILPSTPE